MKTLARQYSERAIVLHTTKYGERKIIAHLLTRSHGRRSYIGTVGSSERSVGRAVLQPLYVIDFQSNQAGETLHPIRDVRLTPPAQGWSGTAAKPLIAMFIAELLYRVITDSDQQMFDFVESSLTSLRTLNSTEQPLATANFHLLFIVRLAAQLGYAPTMNHRQGDFFDIKEGSFTSVRPTHPLYFEPSLACLLARLQVISVEELGSLAIDGKTRRVLLSAMIDYYGFHTQSIYSVRSIELFAEI